MATSFVLKFSKSGYARYTSHLDMLRFFKRAFRKSGIALRYSQGFNPHPRMGFAQPLSLGYAGMNELLEFETASEHEAEQILRALDGEMPEGIRIISVQAFVPADFHIRSLAAATDSADYTVLLPYSCSQEELDKKLAAYLSQKEIMVQKRRKKAKKPVAEDIRPKLRSLSGRADGKSAALTMTLDAGSTANLSPELVISSFLASAGLDIPRYKIDVVREQINFVNNLQF